MADKIIAVPGAGNIAFPDSMADEDIARVIRLHTPEPATKGSPEWVNWRTWRQKDLEASETKQATAQGKGFINTAIDNLKGLWASLPHGTPKQIAQQQFNNVVGVATGAQAEAAKAKAAAQDPTLTPYERGVSAAGHSLAAVLPFGPQAAQTGEQIANGQYGDAAANALFLLGPSAVMHGPEALRGGARAVKTGIQAVAPGLLDATADSLHQSGTTQYARVLNPTTNANKARTAAIVPELMKRGETALTLRGLNDRATGQVAKFGQLIGQAWDNLPAGTTTELQPIYDRLQNEIENEHSIPDANGKLIPKSPVAKQAIGNLNSLQEVLMDVAEPDPTTGELRVPVDKMRSLRQYFDQVQKDAGAFEGKNLSQQAVGRAHEVAADAIRAELAKDHPDIAALNKEYSFWSDVARVTGDTLQRRQGQRVPLTTRIAQAAGFAKGGFAGAEAMKQLTTLTSSPAWGTMSAVLKDRLANAIATGNPGAVQFTLNQIAGAAPAAAPGQQPPPGAAPAAPAPTPAGSPAPAAPQQGTGGAGMAQALIQASNGAAPPAAAPASSAAQIASAPAAAIAHAAPAEVSRIAAPPAPAAEAPAPVQSEAPPNEKASSSTTPVSAPEQPAESDSGGNREGAPAPKPSNAGTQSAARKDEHTGNETSISIPGSNARYRAVYKLVPGERVQASHNGQTFEANPRYLEGTGITNERDYTNIATHAKVVENSTRENFDPKYIVSDIEHGTDGPSVALRLSDDGDYHLAGGNARDQIQQRVYAQDPKRGLGLVDLMAKRADRFGFTPEQVYDLADRGLEPRIIRELHPEEIATPEKIRNMIADLNKSGTGALTPAEQAIADSRRVSPETLDHIAQRLEDKGPDATLAQILEGKSGIEILQRLLDDGVIAKGQRAALANEEQLTPAGKQRVSQLMLGRFFENPAQLDHMAPSIRNKVERLAAPLARVEATPYNLSGHIQQAMGLLEALPEGSTIDHYLAQGEMFPDMAPKQYSPEAVALAKQLQDRDPNALVKSIRAYGEDAKYAAEQKDQEGFAGMLPDPRTPAEAFKEHFGDDAIANEAAAKAEKKAAKQQPAAPAKPELKAPAAAAAPTKNPFANIPDSHYELTPAQKGIQNAFRNFLKSNPAAAIADYLKRFTKDGGTVEISADNGKELSGDYMKDPSHATKAVHEGGSAVAKEAYRLTLDQPAPEGKADAVLATAGGSGSGKTTATKTVPSIASVRSQAHIIYDATLSKFDSAQKVIDAALKANKKVVYAYVDRDPLEAWKGAIGRAKSEGRTIPPEYHIDGHIGARETLDQLREKYKDNPDVQFRAIDNRGAPADAHEIDPDAIPKADTIDRGAALEAMQKALDEALANGEITKKIYNEMTQTKTPKK
jgi:hypothetical protein